MCDAAAAFPHPSLGRQLPAWFAHLHCFPQGFTFARGTHLFGASFCNFLNLNPRYTATLQSSSSPSVERVELWLAAAKQGYSIARPLGQGSPPSCRVQTQSIVQGYATAFGCFGAVPVSANPPWNMSCPGGPRARCTLDQLGKSDHGHGVTVFNSVTGVFGAGDGAACVPATATSCSESVLGTTSLRSTYTTVQSGGQLPPVRIPEWASVACKAPTASRQV